MPSASSANSDVFAVSDWRVSWQTPEQIRWAWSTTGTPEQFGGFRLLLAATPQELESAPARVVTGAENPELTGWLLPETEGPSRTRGTTTREHSPGDTVAARLQWIVNGETFESEVITTTMPPQALQQFEIYEDTAPAPYTIPDTFQESTVAPYSGTKSYAYTSVCDGTASCWEHLRWAEMNLDLSAIPTAMLDRAFVEFALSYSGKTPSYWSEFFLQWASCKPCRFGEVALFLPADGKYRIYQIPIRALHNGSAAISATEWLSGLDEFRVGGGWSDGGVVHIDHVRIRW